MPSAAAHIANGIALPNAAASSNMAMHRLADPDAMGMRSPPIGRPRLSRAAAGSSRAAGPETRPLSPGDAEREANETIEQGMSYRLPLDLDALRARVRDGQSFAFVPFYGHSAEPGRITNAVYSQFYPAEFKVDGERFRWAEQWMMPAKARLFGDQQALAAILAADEPLVCKRINTLSLCIERVATTGDGPGWLSRHTAERLSETSILVVGGMVQTASDYGPMQAYLSSTLRQWRGGADSTAT